MRHVIVALLLCLPLGAVVRQDNFERADGTLGSNWNKSLASATQIKMGGVYPGASGETDAVWTGDTFGDDQFSQIRFRETSPIHYTWMGVWVRRNTAGTQGYFAFCYSGQILVYYNSSGFAGLTGSYSHTCASGDVLKLTAVGNSPVALTVYLNGSQIISTSDGAHTWTGGSPGFAINSAYDYIVAVESWSGGDGDGTGTSEPAVAAPFKPVSGMHVYNPRLIGGLSTIDCYADDSTAAKTVRWVTPDNPASKPHRNVFLLPVEPGIPAITYGDGLEEAIDHNLHNNYNATVLEFSCSGACWTADHTSDIANRNETFTLDLIEWAQVQFGGGEQWVTGYSRGIGAVDLLLKYPNIVSRAAVFDLAADWTWAETGPNTSDFGTQENYETNYQLNQTFLNAHAAALAGTTRLWISTDSLVFGTAMTNLRGRLGIAGIQYTQSLTGATLHQYDGGWLPYAFAGLDAQMAGVSNPMWFSIP